MSNYRRARRAIAGLLVAVVASLGLAVVASTPAAAAYSYCPAGQAGVFKDTGGNGTALCIVFSQHTPGACYNVPSGLNDAITSVIVTFGSGYGLNLYSVAGCAHSNPYEDGLWLRNQYDDNLSDNYRAPVGNWNDVISSYRISLQQVP